MKKKMGNVSVWALLLGTIVTCAACSDGDQTTAEDLAAGSEPEPSSRELASSAASATATTPPPLYSPYYLRNWPSGDGQTTQWSDLFINNPNDTPALVTIRIHKQGGGVTPHAVRQQTIPAHNAWNSYGQSNWLDIPFTDPANSASSGWIEISADYPVIATQRLTLRTGNTYNSPVASLQDDALVTETSRTLYAPFYLKNWSTGYSGKTQWSSLVLVNPGCCATANVTIKVHKVEGTVNGTNLLGSITQSIPPGDAFNTYSLPAWLNLPDTSPHVGWVEVTSDQPIFGTNRVTVRNGSTYNAPIALFQDEAMSGVTDTRLGTSLFWKGWQWPSSGTDRREWSSLVLVNPNALPATAKVRIYAPSGAEIKSFTKTIAAGAWWSSYNDTDWNQVPDGARGWIDVEMQPTPMPSPQLPVPAQQIFGNHRKSVVESSIYTGSTLVDLDDEALTRPASTVYASAYLKNWPAGGSNTQWSSLIVSNPEPTAATLTLNVYGMDGVLLKTLWKSLPAHGWWNAYCDTDWLSVPATASFTTGPASLGWIELSANTASIPGGPVPVRATNRVTLNAGTTCGAPIVHVHDVTAATTQP